MLMSEDQPVSSARSGRNTVLQKSAKGCDPGAGSNHDHRSFRIRRRTKMRGILNEDRNSHLLRNAFREKGGADASPQSTREVASDNGHREMNLLGVSFGAGSNGI